MAIAVACACGATFNLKDEFAGRSLKCPKCGSTIQAPALAVPLATSGPPVLQYASPTFSRDRFLLRQKHLAISTKYYVWDEQGQTIAFVHRPAHVFRRTLAVLAGFVTAIAITGGVFALAAALTPDEETRVLISIGGFLIGVVLAVAIGMLLTVKRHITFYDNDRKETRLMEILQDYKWTPINSYYTVRETDGTVMARLHKNSLYNLIRKRWYCYRPDGSMLCIAKEDSILLSLLRRFLGNLAVWLFMRTNFIILEGNTDQIIGEFNRKFTILDRYVLDMSADTQEYLDRRIALALGVMLDTGERR
jgi:hypothetical protein